MTIVGCRADLYEHVNYQGKVETWSESAREVRHNDAMSSLKVSKDCCVTVFEHVNYEGKSKRMCESVSQVPSEWNDIVSSFKMEPGI